MNTKKAPVTYVAVTNDLATDQRVLKVCRYLSEMGFRVTMVGICKPNSLPVNADGFSTKRFKMMFRKGFLFYAEYNIRLFFFLLFRKTDLVVSNDLDTLAACYFSSVIKRNKLVYDSHEYFLGSAEIIDRPVVHNTWGLIERIIFPRLNYIFTVNESIAGLYLKQYGKRPLVVRNLPRKFNPEETYVRGQLGLPADKKIVIMQGGAINVDRGAEELVRAMLPQYGLKDVHLIFIGGGDKWEDIRDLAHNLQLDSQVSFIPRLPYEQMMSYTRLCDLGVSLDKPIGVNYQYSLPNKLFDYLMAGIPVLTSPLVEVQKIVSQYNVGLCIESHDPSHIASRIAFMFESPGRYAEWKEAALQASQELCWENEQKVLDKVYPELYSLLS